jgi:hypothetical protein
MRIDGHYVHRFPLRTAMHMFPLGLPTGYAPLKGSSVRFLCPFAVYYLRYAVRSFFTMSRISLADGKRAGQKVQRKIAVAVQKVKPLYFLSRSFEI